MEKTKLIKQCKRGKPMAQKLLYDTYAPRFLAVCKRYMKSLELSEDMLMKGFVKIFENIGKLEDPEKLEGWMRRIFVNECLMELRKQNNFNIRLETTNIQVQQPAEALQNLYEEDILKLLDDLPVGCRTVFNLYAIEGLKHSEIAKELNISEGTSKSQYNLAKKKLKHLLSQCNLIARKQNEF